MTKDEFIALCRASFEQNGISGEISNESYEKLYQLSIIFSEKNKVMNLTAIRDESLIISRHFADCLVAEKYFPKNSSVIDIGSGGGMPTLPLAIVRPDLDITALDATAKKTAYIADTARELGLSNVHTITGRAEEIAHTAVRESFDCATARAVAELRVLMEWCVPYVKKGGLFIALKGKKAAEELNGAQGAISALNIKLIKSDESTLFDPDGEKSERCTLVFEKTEQNSKNYPRKNSLIMKKPL